MIYIRIWTILGTAIATGIKGLKNFTYIYNTTLIVANVLGLINKFNLVEIDITFNAILETDFKRNFRLNLEKKIKIKN